MIDMKQKVLTGHVENNVVLLDENIELPDGLKVKIVVADEASGEVIENTSGLCGIWQDDRAVEEIVAEIIGARSAGRDLPTL